MKKYTPSGKCSPAIVPAAIAMCAVAGVIGWYYQVVMNWMPIIYLNFLLTIGFCIATFMCAAFAIKLGKCRNVAVGSLVGLGIGIVALTATYRSGMHDLSQELAAALKAEGKLNDTEANALKDGLGFSGYVELRKEMGWHISYKGKGDMPITGGMVLLFWFVEGAMVLLTGYAGGDSTTKEPFSEVANRWADHKVVVREQDVDGELISQLFKTATSVDDLVRPIPVANPLMVSEPRVLKYHVATCPGGEDVGFLTVESIKKVRDKEGKEKEESETLFSHIVLEPRQLDALEAEWKRANA